jgi:3-oxoacyl-[acyl-carrier-protein] synthase-1
MDKAGTWIIGSEVPLEEPWRGIPKLVRLVSGAVRECLDAAPAIQAGDIPLLLCIAEEDRPGRLDGLLGPLFHGMQEALGVTFAEASRIFAEGRVGGAHALAHARSLIAGGGARCVIVAGVDSYLVGPTLSAYDQRNRVLTEDNSDGFIPGEAAGAVLVTAAGEAGALVCRGMGFAEEPAPVESDEPLRADGLVAAMKAAFAEAGAAMADMNYRIAGLGGEQYGFKEDALAVSRTLRESKEEFDIWHPADCIGETGAAALPCMLGVALAAARKGYAPGGTVLCHLGNDDGKRAALVLHAANGGAG